MVEFAYLLTASGRHLCYDDPRPEDISILDIAQGLANEARYNGHTRGFYSVAQHSFLASIIVPRAFALEALLHDATEAYIKDLPRPLKSILPGYAEIEDRLDSTIRAKFGLPLAMTPTVKQADLQLLAAEKRDLMPNDPDPWPIIEGIEPWSRRIEPAAPGRAYAMFLRRYTELAESKREAA